jgi:hypothetical protein
MQTNTKIQTTNPKQTPSFKFQNAMKALVRQALSLVFECYLDFGDWNLVFATCPHFAVELFLPVRIFARTL